MGNKRWQSLDIDVGQSTQEAHYIWTTHLHCCAERGFNCPWMIKCLRVNARRSRQVASRDEDSLMQQIQIGYWTTESLHLYKCIKCHRDPIMGPGLGKLGAKQRENSASPQALGGNIVFSVLIPLHKLRGDELFSPRVALSSLRASQREAILRSIMMELCMVHRLWPGDISLIKDFECYYSQIQPPDCVIGPGRSTRCSLGLDWNWPIKIHPVLHPRSAT